MVKAGYVDKSCNILIKEWHVYVLGISIAVLIEAICVCCRKPALWLFRMIKLIKKQKNVTRAQRNINRVEFKCHVKVGNPMSLRPREYKLCISKENDLIWRLYFHLSQ